jgi:hypothetical protein
MAFLDNSGDIILDAVLTDEGRRRLAEGKGTFRITKFALGDDEIDYGLYDKNHPSGSAYFDLEILQTPIFEAFTNNGSSMKSKIISIGNPNLLYLPVIKLNDQNSRGPVASGFGVDTFLIPVDKTTSDKFEGTTNLGILISPADDELSSATFGSRYIRVDQGLDTTSISPSVGLSSDLRENTFIIEMDNRLGVLVSGQYEDEFIEKTPSNVDDDDIATYSISATTDTAFVSDISNNISQYGQVISGPRGNKLQFRVRPKIDLAESDYYFDLFGATDAAASVTSAPLLTNVKYIDSFVTIYGASTGYTVQIPIRFLKDNS